MLDINDGLEDFVYDDSLGAATLTALG